MRRASSNPVVPPRFSVFLVTITAAALLGPAAWMVTSPADTANQPPRPVAGLIVASLNLAMERDAALIANQIRAIPVLDKADVIFAQEVVAGDRAAVAQDVAARLGRTVAFASPDGRATRGGLAIFTRAPLRDLRTHHLQPQNLIFRSRKRIALAGTLDSPVGPVRLINTHLDTRINPGQRLNQLQPALDDAKAFAGPAVIGGDFNTNDMQWVSNVVPVPFPNWQASRVRILMESRGFLTPFQSRRATFDHLGMQLDWIYTHGLKPATHGIEPLDFSDHHAIWAQLVK